MDNAYTYDNAGQRLTNTIGSLDAGGNAVNRVETYGYDELNRVNSVNYGDGQTQSYTFDAMGNRASKTDAGGGINGTENYGYNNANMLLSRAGNNYTNDANGNTLTGGGRTNTWDSRNRMVSCAYSGNTSTFTYGSDGLRHRSVVNGVATDFVTDASMFVRELSGGSSKATYFMGASGPAYRRDDVTSGIRWYLYDGLGSVLGEVAPDGSITATRKYDVYRAVRSSTGTSTSKHKFVGSLGHPSEDETNLTYMQARYYDPQTGRFVSDDPNRDGLNWYAYCDNNPVNKTDSDGKASHADDTGLGFALSFIAVLEAGVLLWCSCENVLGLRSAAVITAMIMLTVREAAYHFALGQGGSHDQARRAAQMVPGTLFGSASAGVAAKKFEMWLKAAGREGDTLSLYAGRMGTAVMSFVVGYSIACASEIALSHIELQ